MKTDKLVLQRFDELEQKATTIKEKRVFDFQSNEGVKYFNIDSASFRGWATSVLNILQRVFGEESVHYRNFDELYRDIHYSEIYFEECRAICRAAREDYEGGYLFKIRGLIQAEVFDNVLDQATELLGGGYKDPACVVAGVALETTLKELCARNGIAQSKLDRMNADLAKAGVYNVGMQKQITAWADRRNKAAHGDWSAYSSDDVGDMIRGVTRLIAESL
jgi:hypothetical protein